MELPERVKLEAGYRGLQVARVVGLERRYLDVLSQKDPATDPLENLRVDPDIRDYELAPEDRRGTVFIPIVQGRSAWYRRCVFAHAFRTRGYEPVILRCHAHLPFCQRQQVDGYNALRCGLCIHHGESLLERFGLGAVTIGDILGEGYQPPDPGSTSDGTYRGVDVQKFATATARAYRKRFHLEDDIRPRFVESAMMVTDAAHAVMDRYDLDAVVGTDPAYNYDGIFLSVAETYGVPAANECPGRMPGTHVFSYQRESSQLPWFTDKEYLHGELRRELSPRQRSRVDDIMTQRKRGENLRFFHVPHAEQGFESHTGRTAGLFTNLMWDASLAAVGGIYADPFEWIADTIEFAGRREDLTLVVKTHPAETLRGTNELTADWIRSTFDPVPENVRILEPDTDVSPYELQKTLDFGIVYNSTVGMEMAYEGVPVVVVGETHYRDLGFTWDPATFEEYTALLDELDRGAMSDDRLELARRYAYFFFVRKHVDFEYPRHFDDQVVEVRHDDITPGNENFDLIVRKILDHEPVVNPPEAEGG